MVGKLIGLKDSERVRKFLFALGVLIILVSLPTIVFMEFRAYQQTDRYHAASIAKDNEIRSAQKSGHALLEELHHLQQVQALLQVELNADFTKASTALDAGQKTLILQLFAINANTYALCEAVDARCTPPPKP